MPLSPHDDLANVTPLCGKSQAKGTFWREGICAHTLFQKHNTPNIGGHGVGKWVYGKRNDVQKGGRMYFWMVLLVGYVGIWAIEPILQRLVNLERYTNTFLFLPINKVHNIICEIIAIRYGDIYKPAQALGYYQRILRYHRSPSLVYINIAVCYIMLHDYHHAQKALEKALSFDSKHPLIYLNLAGSYVGMGGLDEALKHAQKAVDLNPNYCMGYCLMSLVATHHGHYEEALKLANQALDNFGLPDSTYTPNPDHIRANILNQRAITYVLLNHAEEGVLDAKQALTLRPYDKEFMATLAVAYYQTGNIEQAGNFWNQAVAIDPRYADASALEMDYHPAPAFMEMAHTVAEQWVTDFPAEKAKRDTQKAKRG